MKLIVTSVAFAVLLTACSEQRSNDVVPSVGASTSSMRHVESLKVKNFVGGVTPGFPKGATAWDIVGGSDGAIWFTDVGLGRIGRLDPGGKGQVKEFSAGLEPGATPLSIISASDGNLWFSDAGNGDIGRITPSGSIVEYSNPRFATAYATSIVESDNALWSVEVDVGKSPPSYLARTSLQGKVRVIMIPSDLLAQGPLTADDLGNLWFMATNADKQLLLVRRLRNGRFERRSTGLIDGAEPCCPNVAPKRLLVDSNNNPWFTTLYYSSPETGPTNELAAWSNTGINFYSLRSQDIQYPVYVSGVASDGRNVWVIGDDIINTNGGLYRVGAHGKFSAYGIPYVPVGIAIINKSVWFTSSWWNNPGEISQVVSL
jgi:hypothetical protein